MARNLTLTVNSSNLTWSVREHFASPLLQYAEADKGETFTLLECPSWSNNVDSYSY